MLKFNLHDQVKLPNAIHKELTGMITSIWITEKAIKYEVRYFWEGKPQEGVYFYEWEIKKNEN